MIYRDFENILVSEDNGMQKSYSNKYRNMLLVDTVIN